MASSVSAKLAPHCPHDAYVLGISRDFPNSDCFGRNGEFVLPFVSSSALKIVRPLLTLLEGTDGSKADANIDDVTAKTAADNRRKAQGILWIAIILFALVEFWFPK
jgi:hypothetical protein